MNTSMALENQLLVTKLYVPVRPGSLISRPRLTSLLNESLKYPLTLVSAAAGFGKTTLLASWSQSLPSNNPRVAWVSLDEEDNEPRLFWTYVLAALQKQLPERFRSLLTFLQSLQPPPLNYLLAELINVLVEETETFLLILDDYHVITEQQVHTTLTYLIEHLPPQLRIIVATRADPVMPLAQLRARKQVLEVRTDQLRCTLEETKAFLHEVMGLSLPDETIQEITTRTEGWLVGLQLLGLSLPELSDPLTLLQEVSGDQRYILDYLTQEVLNRQPQEVRTFLLSTCILERFTASLCDALLQQSGSQQVLQQLEKANLLIVSLDSKRQWYRYHALFVEALRNQLELMHPDWVPMLHHRASLWYAQRDQLTQAILHALHAKEWQWAADLIEQISVLSLTLGATEHELVRIQEWLKQLPTEILYSRPHLCLVCAEMLWVIAPPSLLGAWLDSAEATLTASLVRHAYEDISHTIPSSEVWHDQEDLLGQIRAFRAFIQTFMQSDDDQQKGEAGLLLCQQALASVSEENFIARVQVAWSQLTVYYHTLNKAKAAVESGLQGLSAAMATGHLALPISVIGTTTLYMVGVGCLRKVQQLTQQAVSLGKSPEGFVLPEVGWPTVWQAEVFREWNKLDVSLSLGEEAIELCRQTKTQASLVYYFFGYAVLLRIHLSRGDLEGACAAFQHIERISRIMSQPLYLHLYSQFTVIDQARLWLACGELDRATHWFEESELLGKPFPCVYEREEVARACILLARKLPNLALQRLEAALERATRGQRWGNVIGILLQQALAYQMLQQESQAFQALSEAVRLAEPEGYIRSFVDEGASMELLLYRLRRRNRQHGLTPYLDTLLAAFQQETKTHAQPKEPAQAYQLPEPLSQREQEVLQLLVSGASNQEIAQELVITRDTVKRHVNHIFSKLGVHNRVQAVKQAQELGLLDEEV